MARYTIAFMSMSTGTPLEFGHADDVKEALKMGRTAEGSGLRDVKVIDMTTGEGLAPAMFEAKHKR